MRTETETSQVCVGWKYGQDATANYYSMGRCKNATARFTPATSTRIGWLNVATNPS